MPIAGRLGKLPAIRDPRTLKLENYLTPKAAPTPPASRDWTHGIKQWGMMLNDQLGCCTCAAMGHAEQLWTANTSTEVTVPDGAVLAAYEAVGGYVPGQANTDNGAALLTVLKYWMNTGINGHKIAGYATVPLTPVWIETVIDLFGLAFIGFAVPNSAMQQFNAGQPWFVVSPDGGIEGGHCVVLVDYDATGPSCITWGSVQKMSWDFFSKYCSMSEGEGEAFAVITKEWLAANGTSPSGLNWAQMQADIADVQSQTAPPFPGPTPTPTPAVTSTTLVSPGPVTAGQSFNLNATVVGGTPAPTGNVTVIENGAVIATVQLVQGGATVAFTYTAAGTHSLTARYAGDAANAPSTSAAISIVVQAPTPPPFVPNPDIVRGLAWLKAWGDYLPGSYQSGDVTDTRMGLGYVASYAPQILANLPAGVALREEKALPIPPPWPPKS